MASTGNGKAIEPETSGMAKGRLYCNKGVQGIQRHRHDLRQHSKEAVSASIGKPGSTWTLLGPTVSSVVDRWLEERCDSIKGTESAIEVPSCKANYGDFRFVALSPLLGPVWDRDMCALRRLMPPEPIVGEDEDDQHMPPMRDEYVKLCQRLPAMWPGSFGQMQVTDPPCRKIRYIASWESRETPCYDERTQADGLESEGGVTLGMIQDHAVKKRIRYYEAYNEFVQVYNNGFESHRELLEIFEPYRSRMTASAKRITELRPASQSTTIEGLWIWLDGIMIMSMEERDDIQSSGVFEAGLFCTELYAGTGRAQATASIRGWQPKQMVGAYTHSRKTAYSVVTIKPPGAATNTGRMEDRDPHDA